MDKIDNEELKKIIAEALDVDENIGFPFLLPLMMHLD